MKPPQRSEERGKRIVDLDFSTLSLKDALDLAILIEEEARERYQEFESQLTLFNTDLAAGFFSRMADIEAEHQRLLAERRTVLFGDLPSSVERSMLWDVEAPGVESVRAFMSLRQALEVALRAERDAFEFYDRASPLVSDPEVKALFTQLRAEEVEHQKQMGAEIARLPADSKLEPDDYVDPPRAL
jgi:rubrerythrin